ncbi:MAG: Fur family transcriptional regulator [bacterium]
MSTKEKVFRDYLKQKGLKFTPERQLVLKYAFEIHSHFEAEDLFLKIRKSGNRVSKGTIYRTLPLLIDCNLIRTVEFVEQHLHYEHVLGHKHHEHLVCLKCGQVIEFYNGIIEDELERICSKNKFRLNGHKIEATGYCEKCQ